MTAMGGSTEAEEVQALNNGVKPEIVAGLDRSPANGRPPAIPLGEQTRAVRRQELMVILGNIGVLSVGIALGLPTVTMNQLTDPNEPVYLTTTQATWFASIITLASPVGGLLSGYILDKCGRKRTLYVVNVMAIVAWSLMYLNVRVDPQAFYVQLLISRFLCGMATGLASAPVGVYSAEISLPRIRGRLILGTSISIAAGITFVYILGYLVRDNWRLLSLITLCYQIVALLCVIPMPESPSWLVSKGRLAEAKASLNYFRGQEKSAVIIHPEVAAEFNLLQKSIQLGEGEKKPSFWSLLPKPEVHRPLLIMVTLFAFQQLTGIFVVIVYAVQIAANAGVSIDPFMCAILIGFARLLTTCPMGIILEKWGRRRSAMISTTGMFICMLLLALRTSTAVGDWFAHIPYLPLLAIVAFIVLSTLGLYTLPFFMISELFPQKVRGPASGLSLAVGMLISFVCLKLYPFLQASIGVSYCFVLFALMALMALLFIYLVLPETRGRTLLEIEDYFKQKKNPRQGRSVHEVEMREVFVK